MITSHSIDRSVAGAVRIHVQNEEGMRLVLNSSVDGYCYDLPRNEFPAGLKGILCCRLEASAARNFHAHDSYVLDVVVGNYCSKFLRIIDIIQFRAADYSGATLHEIFVHIGICICCAISCDEKACSFKERSLSRHEFNLARPLSEP